MKPLFLAILAVLFLAPPTHAAASQGMMVATASSAHDSPGMRCRRIQRAAQSVMASKGGVALAYSGHQKIVKKPRRMVRRMIGYSYKHRDVSLGCFRCITRQLIRHIPVGLQGACGTHSPCESGDALDAATDACAALVCVDHPDCCSTEWSGDCVAAAAVTCDLNCDACVHDICVAGASLDSSCDPCAGQICESDPFCCDTEWSDECVGEVATICQQGCEPTATTTTTVEGGATTTVPSGSTTTTPTGSSSTVPELTTTTAVGGLTTTSAVAATTTTIVGPTTTVPLPPGCDESVISFEDDPAGTRVSMVETSDGKPVTVTGRNPRLGTDVNASLLYDSTCTPKCTGGDTDLGTPNESFGGPGIGEGGAAGSDTANDESLHNLLIIATALEDENHDGLVDNPNDQKNTTVTQEFDFSAFAPVSVLGVKLVDVGDTEGPASVELFDSHGNSILKVEAPDAENNGLVKLNLPDNQNVWKMIVTLHGSGGIDDIRLGCGPAPSTTTTSISGGTTSTVPSSSTTVPASTTTLPSGTTTTAPAGTTTTIIGGGTTTTAPTPTTTVPGGTTTTQPAATTTVPGGTTTTIIGGTTTTQPSATTTQPPATTTTLPAATTTTVPVGGVCPDTVELTLLAGTREECTTTADCEFGTCNTTIGRCQTQTELDTGWTGIAHDSDITDNVVLLGNVNCPGPGPVCGQCDVAGVNPEPGNCRCANDNQKICNEKFAADADDCGGAQCVCYLGPPLSLSAGNTPACVVNKFAQDVTGTTNLDSGEGALQVHLRSVVYLGETLVEPCPHCDGDVTPNDGVKDGTCALGEDAGAKCDDNGINRSFPAPGGGGHSLDCFPTSGKNVSGAGLIINLNQTTGTTSLGSNVTCGFPPQITEMCHCGICSNDGSIPCDADGDCPTGGTCKSKGAFDPSPNGCAGVACEDIGNGEAQCATGGPTDKGCNGILKANGDFFITCTSNGDCEPANIGVDAGACTLEKKRECFLPTITATGDPDPTLPVGVSTFCIAPTANPGINSVAGLPGPGRIQSQGHTVARCGDAVYTPGVGCP